jgi:hypothetical protein
MKHKNVDLSSLQIGILISLLKEYLKGLDPIGVQHFQDQGDPTPKSIRKEAEPLLKYLESEQESFRPKSKKSE